LPPVLLVLFIPVAKFAIGVVDTGGKFGKYLLSELEGKNVYMCNLYYPKVSQQNY
jgi:hypothetical protein